MQRGPVVTVRITGIVVVVVVVVGIAALSAGLEDLWQLAPRVARVHLAT